MKKQMSDKLIISILLALAGGIMDAYSYTLRGKTFATLQTGNLILMGINFVNNNTSKALMYLLPIMSFTIGSFISQIVENISNKLKFLHWRQVSIVFEIIMCIIVSFIPQGDLDFLANMLISYAAGMQLQSFRKTKGLGIATTMCTGNMKSFGASIANAITYKDKKILLNSLIYLSLILSFFVGVLISYDLARHINTYTTLIALIPLLIVFILMFIKFEEEFDSEIPQNE